MLFLNFKKAILTSFISMVVFSFKLFSVVLKFPDDSTNMLAFRASPSLNNEVLLYDYLNGSSYFVVISDENGFLGKGLYGFIVDYLAYALVFFSVFLWFLYIRNEQGKLTGKKSDDN